MERTPNCPPRIAPHFGMGLRPRLSIMIPVYNCSQFIPEVLETVLMQDLGEDFMQIEVVDDASTDADVEALVLSIGKGRVKYYKQPQNVGSLRNFETCINRAKGYLVHLLHGDDRVKMGFYEKMNDIFNKYPDAGAAFCNYTPIDHFGNARKTIAGWHEQQEGYLIDPLYVIGIRRPAQYVSMVVKRSVYEDLGSFYGVIAGEDWEMWTRIASKYPIAFTPENLADYRKTFGSITLPKIETGRNALDFGATIKRVESMLPDRLLKEMKWNRELCAKMCLSRAMTMIKQKKKLKEVRPLFKLAMEMMPSNLHIYLKILKINMIYYKLIFQFKKKEEAKFEELLPKS